MPDLPTITVSTEQQTRILNALKDSFGTATTAETIVAYKKWLASMLKDIVYNYETKSLEAQKTQTRTNIDTTLIDPIV